MKPKVYIETSVVSYLTARPSKNVIMAANQLLTVEWWDQRSSDFDLFISELVIREARAGDPQAALLRLQTLASITPLVLTADANQLSAEVLKKKHLPLKAADDALHLAIATVHKMDYLLTWNCKHLANVEIQRDIAKLFRANGYEPPVICTPYLLM
ncbi:MAG: type II toxin-antitoxin system VapC family toxin [Acidobacteriota bacterium]